MINQIFLTFSKIQIPLAFDMCHLTFTKQFLFRKERLSIVEMTHELQNAQTVHGKGFCAWNLMSLALIQRIRCI